MQNPEASRGQVALAAEGVEQPAPRGWRQSDRHGIDREVAPSKVQVDRSRAHLRQGARHAITLAARGGDVHAPDSSAIRCRPAFEGRRAEGGVDYQVTARLLGEPPPEGDAVTFHDEVEVGHARWSASEEEVPDEAADRKDRLPLRLAKLARGAQQPEPRLSLGALEALESRVEPIGRRRRTGRRLDDAHGPPPFEHQDGEGAALQQPPHGDLPRSSRHRGQADMGDVEPAPSPEAPCRRALEVNPPRRRAEVRHDVGARRPRHTKRLPHARGARHLRHPPIHEIRRARLDLWVRVTVPGHVLAGLADRAGVELPVHRADGGGWQVGVDLRGRDVGVTEHRLDRAQVRAALQ